MKVRSHGQHQGDLHQRGDEQRGERQPNRLENNKPQERLGTETPEAADDHSQIKPELDDSWRECQIEHSGLKMPQSTTVGI
jgi:hypothetical protein